METWYPGAVRKPDFSKSSAYGGSPMTPNCVCLHSTEGLSLPGYQSGATTPHFTAMADMANKKVVIHQHLPINRSARALENRSGGVQTNTFGVVQIEMDGTCDSQYAKSWTVSGRKYLINEDYVYMEAPPEWFIRGLADLILWLSKQMPKFKIEDAAKGWKYYRKNGSTSGGSYGLSNGIRFNSSEWNNVYGIFGHQHVPENVHGDPGLFPIKALVDATLALRDGTTPPPVVTPDPPDPTLPPKVYDKMDPKSYFRGVVGAHVTWYGQQIVKWHKALGLPSPYKIGPGPEWGPADEKGTQNLQLRFWPGASTEPGGDADGFPGSQLLTKIAVDPPVQPAPPAPVPNKTRRIKTVSLNRADYDAKHGEKTKNARDAAVARAVLSWHPDIIHLQECSASQVDDMDALFKGYKRVPQGGKGRETWYKTGIGIKILGAELHDVKTHLDGDTKQFLLTAYEVDGFRAAEACYHNENQGKSVQKAQMHEVLHDLNVFADKFQVPAANRLAAGDSNAKETAERLKEWDWRDAAVLTTNQTNRDYHSTNNWTGPTTKGRRIDILAVRPNAVIRKFVNFLLGGDNVSDHNGQYLERDLIK